MKKDIKFYSKFFLSVFSLSAFTFGGGYVIVPLMRKKFVEQLKWLEEDEMLDLIGIAQSTPGAIAVNTSILVGYKLAGIPGALIGAAGTVLPPLIIITIISTLYTLIRDNPVVDALMKGMRIGVAVVIADAVISLIKNIIKTKSLFQVLILVSAFVLVFFFNVSLIIIILASITLGAVYTLIKNKRKV